MNVDLPNLSSIINSQGYSFYYTRLVTLEGSPNIEYWSYVDIPNLHRVDFSDDWDAYPFELVQSKSISSSPCLIWLYSQMFPPFLLILSSISNMLSKFFVSIYCLLCISFCLLNLFSNGPNRPISISDGNYLLSTHRSTYDSILSRFDKK